jgi:hypothetical protein
MCRSRRGKVAEQLGVSVPTVRNALRASNVAIRPGGLPHVPSEQRSRHLFRDLHRSEETFTASCGAWLVVHGLWCMASPCRMPTYGESSP